MSDLTQALVDVGFNARRAEAIEAAILGATLDASNVAFTPAGNIAATDVQAAIEELDTEKASAADLTAHINDTSDAHDASAISYSNSTSGLAATDTQAAIDEVEGRVDTLEGVTSGLVLLNSGTVTNAATLDIVLTGFTAYRGLLFKLINFIPESDAILQMRVSTDGGASYDAGASDYEWAAIGLRSANITQNGADTADDSIQLTSNTSVDSTGAGATFDVNLMNQTAALTPYIYAQGAVVETNAQVAIISVAGRRLNAQETDAVRFFFPAVDFSGTWALYGYA